jgi:hypothetical protein
MEETVEHSKIFWEKRKEANKQFDTTELSNVRKITLILEENPEQKRYHEIEYVVKLIDRPTKWYLQGEKVQESIWYQHTISNNHNFLAELGLIRTTKELNKKLRFGYRVKEIIR